MEECLTNLTSGGVRRSWALATVCVGALMMVLDGTIVVIALPRAGTDLSFSPTGLVWVMNAYSITFAGFLLLSGRLGDLFGYRRIFLAGIILFTVASLGCGTARLPEMLIIGRAMQGLGGAAVSAVVYPICTDLFPEPDRRVKSFSILGFVYTVGGSIALLLGGLLTDLLGWHWIFLVNIPIGVAAYLLGSWTLPIDKVNAGQRHPDLFGASTVTAALLLFVYAIVGGEEWNSYGWLIPLAAAGAFLLAFVWIEVRSSDPIVPFRVLDARLMVTACLMIAILGTAMTTWYFLSTLYLYRVLLFRPLLVGASFLPANLVEGVTTLLLVPRLAKAFHVRSVLRVTVIIAALGIFAFATSRVHGTFLADVLPGTILLGVGVGIAYPTLLNFVMGEIKPEIAGLGSGIINTASLMGGALGVAILTRVATQQTDLLVSSGIDKLEALNAGYHCAFLWCGILTVSAALLSMGLPKSTPPTADLPP